ncbi:MAG TPA: MFS transporter [Gemmatimonadaceae bacterium]|nr:MFS transporter [Gemmatimonadaceae bacterium]
MAHPQHAAPILRPDGEIRAIPRAPARERWSWALYDFSNTIFSMNVATLYFSVWIVSDLGATDIVYAGASAVASLLVVVAIPVLGAISDVRRRRKPWVVGFTVASCVACAAIGVLGQTTLPLVGEGVTGAATVPAGWHVGVGQLFWVLAAFVIANFAYQAAQPFYNAMLPELVPPEEQGRLSGLGTAVGYVGSIAGVIMVFPFFTGGLPLLGKLGSGTMAALHTLMPFTSHAGRVSTFVPTGVLFLLFSLPLFVFCRDHHPALRGAPVEWRRAFREVRDTLVEARRHPGALRFIITSLIYQDAIGTIVSFMTLYAVKAVGFQKGSEVTLFMVLTVPAVFGSYVAGLMVDRIGAKRTLAITLGIWVVLLMAMIAVPTQAAFWGVGLAIGLNFGGVNAAERPMMLTLIPDVDAGRYFSLMLLSARVAAIIGPLLWGLTTETLEGRLGTGIAYRAAVLVVALMFVIALLVLRGVPDRSGRHLAAVRD